MVALAERPSEAGDLTLSLSLTLTQTLVPTVTLALTADPSSYPKKKTLTPRLGGEAERGGSARDLRLDLGNLRVDLRVGGRLRYDLARRCDLGRGRGRGRALGLGVGLGLTLTLPLTLSLTLSLTLKP